MSISARRLQRTGVEAGSAPTSTTTTHGQQLTKSMTSWSALGVSSSDLTLMSVADAPLRVSNRSVNEMPSWILTTPYVYNNNPSNKGGVIPADGMMIDGFMIPAGTYIVQFRDFSNGQIMVEGDINDQYPPFAGLMLRGCKWRTTSPYVGMISENGTSSGGKLWIHYCDFGGLGSNPSQYCEVPLKITNSSVQSYRNYISYTTTGVQFFGRPGTNIIENYIERLTTFNTSGHI